jgi:hypothetical protein
VRFANLKHIYLSLAARQSEAIAPATRCRSWLKRTNYLSINRKSYIYHLQPYHCHPIPHHHITTLAQVAGAGLSSLICQKTNFSCTTRCRHTPESRSGHSMCEIWPKGNQASHAASHIDDMACSPILYRPSSREFYGMGLVALLSVSAQNSQTTALVPGP